MSRSWATPQALAAQLALDAARAYNALAALVPALPFDGDPASALGTSITCMLCRQWMMRATYLMQALARARLCCALKRLVYEGGGGGGGGGGHQLCWMIIQAAAALSTVCPCST